jgi:hypothetical protein
MSVKEYKADFLWPHQDGSLEQLGYEFANAKTEKYRREIWVELISRIKGDGNPVASTESTCNLQSVNGWLSIDDGDWDNFKRAAHKNCDVKFDNGEICKYHDEWPVAKLTHYRVV